MADTTTTTNQLVGRARRLGTMHARQDQDEDRRRGNRVLDLERLLVELAPLTDEQAASDEIKTRLIDGYLAAYAVRWTLIAECEHVLPGRGETGWGTSSGARCINCQVSVEHGTALPIDDLTNQE